MKKNEKKGKVVVISGPSGVGKGTICTEVVKRLPDVFVNVSVTTRPKAKGEAEGKDYFFVSGDEFEELKRGKKLLEYAEVFGNMYGSPRDEVDKALAAGKTVLLQIDVQGGKSVKKIYPDACLIFILPPDSYELQRRLAKRGRDEAEDAKKRLAWSSKEITEAGKFYDYTVVNDKLGTAVEKVIKIICEKQKEQ